MSRSVVSLIVAHEDERGVEPTKRVMAASLRKMPTTSVRRLISPFSRSSGLALCNVLRCWGGKVMEAETVGRGIVHECCELSHLWPELVGDAAPLGLGLLSIVLGEGCRDEGRDDAPVAGLANARLVKFKTLASCVPRASP